MTSSKINCDQCVLALIIGVGNGGGGGGGGGGSQGALAPTKHLASDCCIYRASSDL